MKNCNDGRVPAGVPEAVAWIKGGREHPCIAGRVRFFKRSGGVLVVAQVSGLPASNASGFFAFHIHEGKDCGGEGFADSGGHFNPKHVPHPRHAGDLPPLLSNGGSAYLAVLTDRFTIPEILGRTVIIHAGPDDFRTQPSGDPGMKIACGVIERV